MSLLVSIHNVAPPFLSAVQRMRDALGEAGAHRVTLLAIPNYHGAFPLRAHIPTARWLRGRAEAGDEICQHGFTHEQRGPVQSAWDIVKQTMGDGECLALDPHQAQRVLHRGKQTLEDILGRAVAGFVAPSWLEPRGFKASLRRAGFRWHESRLWVEGLGPGYDGRRDVKLHAPVTGWAARMVLGKWGRSGDWLARPLEALFRVGFGVARLPLVPADAGTPKVFGAFLAAIRRLMPGHPAHTVDDALRALAPTSS